jgi:hypothetical protein
MLYEVQGLPEGREISIRNVRTQSQCILRLRPSRDRSDSVAALRHQWTNLKTPELRDCVAKLRDDHELEHNVRLRVTSEYESVDPAT